jgi:pseudaminic acid biosynthesis-associated methylase
MNPYRTEQEAFWAGEFGDEYARRNEGRAEIVAANVALFARALLHANKIQAILELGANIGINMVALHSLLPQAELHALEINAAAYDELRRLPFVNAVNGSILDYAPPRSFDMTLVKGVLIHIDPAALPDVYDKLFEASNRYVLVMEYFNPVPVEIGYRGHRNRLFKRDFVGELMDRHPSLQLLDYGFAYHRDPKWPQDDTNWFLLEKR